MPRYTGPYSEGATTDSATPDEPTGLFVNPDPVVTSGGGGWTPDNTTQQDDGNDTADGTTLVTSADSPDYSPPSATQADDSTEGFDLRYVAGTDPETGESKGRLIRTEEGASRGEAAQQASESGVGGSVIKTDASGDYHSAETGENLTTETVDSKRAVGGSAAGSDVQVEQVGPGAVTATNPETGESVTGVETRKTATTADGREVPTQTTTILQDDEVVSTGQSGPSVDESTTRVRTDYTDDTGGGSEQDFTGVGGGGAGGGGGGQPSGDTGGSGRTSNATGDGTGVGLGVLALGVLVLAFLLGGNN